MGNRFYFGEETATSFADVAHEIGQLADALGQIHDPREAKSQLLQILRRPDIKKILGDTRVQFLWRDAQKLEDVEAIQTLLKNTSRYMEKEGATEASWENIEAALADMLAAATEGNEPASEDGTSMAAHSPPSHHQPTAAASTSALTTWRSPDGVKYSIKKKSETGEWMVAAYVNGKFDDDKTYYTNDKADAVGTLDAMRKAASKSESGDNPTDPPVEDRGVDAEARWAEMDAGERAGVLKQAGFGSMSVEMSKSAWGAFKPDEKKDIEWVLKAAPGHLGEDTTNQDPDDYLSYKGEKIQKGTRLVVDASGVDKKATVQSIGTKDNEPVIDYIADDGRKGWAYLDQVVRLIPQQEEAETLESALNDITSYLTKQNIPKDMAVEIAMEIKKRAPYLAALDVQTIMMDAGIEESRAEEMSEEAYRILEKYGAVRVETEGVLGPQVPLGPAISGGASNHDGGLDEMQGALEKGDEVEAVTGTYRGLKGSVLKPGKMVEVSVSAPWQGNLHGASMKLTPRDVIHIRESELRQVGSFSGMVDEVRPPSVDPRTKKVLNKYLTELGKKYWDDIPVSDIVEAFRQQGLEIEAFRKDPAGTENLGSEAVGKSGREKATISKGGEEVKNSHLNLSWYVMPSGKYEVVAYLS